MGEGDTQGGKHTVISLSNLGCVYGCLNEVSTLIINTIMNTIKTSFTKQARSL